MREWPPKRREEKRERERKRDGVCARVGERDPRPFGSSFLSVFPPPGPALCKLGYPGVLFILPEVLTLVLGPSFVVFPWLFPSLSFSHRRSGLLFPILTT